MNILRYWSSYLKHYDMLLLLYFKLFLSLYKVHLAVLHLIK